MKTLRRSALLWGLLLVPSALVLGYLGYRDLGGEQMGHTDALFSTLQLFVLEATAPPGETPWTLNVARFIAPLAVVYATVAALLAILREHVQRALVIGLARDHFVLVGLGRSAALLAAALPVPKRQVVVIESDPTNERIPGTRASQGRVLVGDATQPVILQRARVSQARHVIVSTGDDGRNLEVADQVREMAGDGHTAGHRMTIHVRVDDETLWRDLCALQLGLPRFSVTMEFYNVVDRAAQSLLDEAERHVQQPALTTVALEGSGPLARRVLVHLVRRAALTDERAEVHVSSASADALTNLVLADEPWLAEALRIVEVDDPSAAGSATTPPVGLVCLGGTDASALSRALVMARSDPLMQVLVSVEGQQSNAILEPVGVTNVHLVRANVRAVTSDLLHQSAIELMARARHQDYVANERARDVRPEANPSMVPWDELPESLKDSNRHFAESLGETLNDLGGRLVPLRSLEPDRGFVSTGDALERLAKREHDRWMASLVADGWTYAQGPKDPHAKTHPLLVEWDDLDEAEREKDRDGIRAIPTMLARAGLAIEFPGGRRSAV